MKKSLVALAALAVVGAASAQSTVSISGAYRLGFKSNGAAATTVNSIDPDQSSGNVINFNVVEDLGGGLSAIASSQLRYWASNGKFRTQSGDAYDAAGFHLATLGLQSKTLGTFKIGRIGFDQLWGYNPWGSNGANVNVSGTIGGATENGQWQYTSPTFSGFNAVIGGAFKANSTGATQNASQYLVNYANGPFAATALVEETTKAYSGAQKFTGFGASYDFGVAKVMAIKGTDKNLAGTKVADGFSVSATAPVAGFLLKAGYLNDQMAANKDKKSFGVEYALSKRTILEANTYKVKGDAGQTYWLGAKHSF